MLLSAAVSMLAGCGVSSIAGPTTGGTREPAASAPAPIDRPARLSASSEGSGPLVVFNNGNNPNSCSVVGFGGSYQGFATLIIGEDRARLLVCHASLTSGTPVSSTVVMRQDSCTWTFTPSGVVNVSCPHGF